MRPTVLTVLAATLLTGVPVAQEPDIIDRALASPRNVTSNGNAIPYGDYNLDAAERALRDGLPRPWTFDRIYPLFEAAADDWLDWQRSRDDGASERDDRPHRHALFGHLTAVLAASRDPRAALAFGRLIEVQDSFTPGTPNLYRGLLDYYFNDPKYAAVDPLGEGGPRAGNVADILWPRVRAWFALNRAQLEAEAAALRASERQSTESDGASTPEEILATLERLIDLFETRDPRLRVVAADGREIRIVRYSATVKTLQGDLRSSHPGGEVQVEDGWLEFRAGMIGEPAFAVQGTLFAPGYEELEFEIPDSSVRPEPVVTFIPLSNE